MSIPIYESKDDIARERKVAEHLALRWRSSAMPTAPLSPFDYAMCRVDPKDGRSYACAYVEIKCRSKMYDPYWLSKAKWDELLTLSDMTSLPCYLVVHSRESKLIHYTRVERRPYDVIQAGRSDRPDDPKAIEPMMVIPALSFSSAGSLELGP